MEMLLFGFLTAILTSIIAKKIIKKYHGYGLDSQVKDILFKADEEAKDIMSNKQREVSIKTNKEDQSFDEKSSVKLDILDKEIKTIIHNKQFLKKNREINNKRITSSQHKLNNLNKKISVKSSQSKYFLNELKNSKDTLINKITKMFNLNTKEILDSIEKKIIEEEIFYFNKYLLETIKCVEDNSDKFARNIIAIGLSRFARKGCSKKNIPYIFFPNEKIKNEFIKDNEIKSTIEEMCGVDIGINLDDGIKSHINISCYDPVRKEIASNVLKKILNKKRINKENIKNISIQETNHILNKTSVDGSLLLKDLKLIGISKEIAKMLGCLYYRYSFAQNQYFHSSEVGYLCGLLSAELDLEISWGRRAGVLHDIGKSMDHSIEGGHAIIGADFIKKHGENGAICHAVRAHHFEEQPNTPLAYLVISADAISGARPGARRSTVVSLSEKMNALELIAKENKGVKEVVVLSAGREIRLLVDSNEVSDYEALQLSKDVATSIEKNHSYPGQIKVIVIRKTEAFEKIS